MQIGDQIGDYQIVGILGAGGMGRVYKVRNVISDRMEAMKVLLPDLQHETGLGDRFMREIKLQATLHHPNIAQLFTASKLDNQLLMFLEFLEGINVEGAIRSGPIPVRDAVSYMMQTLSALEYAHDRGIIHRDIKPSNMMITPVPGGEGRIIKLMDFGIARAIDHALTDTGVTMGSIYYMSPEQVKGTKTLDARADIYSAGVSLYEMTTGRKPFDGESSYEIMNAHVMNSPEPPRSLNSSIPAELEAAILKAMAKAPGDRFATAREFREALAAVPQTEPSLQPILLEPIVKLRPTYDTPVREDLATTVTIAPRGTKRGRGRRTALWIGGGLAAAAAVVAGLFFLRPPTAQPERSAVTSPVTQPQPQAPTEAVKKALPQPARATRATTAGTGSGKAAQETKVEKQTAAPKQEAPPERPLGTPPRREAAGSEADLPPPPERGRRGPPPPGAPGGPPDANPVVDVNQILRNFNMPPIPVHRPDPAYTEEARKAGLEGAVVLAFDVTLEGAATNIKVVSGLGMGLDEQAVKAVSQWRFRPGMKEGKPAVLPFTATLRFHLTGVRRDKPSLRSKPTNQ